MLVETAQAAQGGGHTGTAIAAVLAGLLIYFLPGIVAAWRDHRHVGPLLVVNALLGWTLLGWAGALAWAVWPRNQ